MSEEERLLAELARTGRWFDRATWGAVAPPVAWLVLSVSEVLGGWKAPRVLQLALWGAWGLAFTVQLWLFVGRRKRYKRLGEIYDREIAGFGVLASRIKAEAAREKREAGQH